MSWEPIQQVLLKCPSICYMNLSSCRALPRGVKRDYQGSALIDLRDKVTSGKFEEKSEDDDD